ncbi:uncharacterized protein L969DRAFT_93776 [Mixia osmundae IAM 14324]|uniref:Uncharacterized protein n=1 Tax=Mixia osmundae (strain CBS 9802 / IAM 14324 / JCM 22182 / KY 12970) TaxID=764103 RepID=G7E9J5_MIXOS|nr:uncharacterized protein L969DRAFT_93776 [Mixia osmundae IAM 14324]KEI39946.1 hypothetical protein L969DRAFT_93776 [Mixia osmundae IAM 14324]GAA99314.1 hypothetical protein E5Q_06009 [Mixia osmundae IAM 14324]
MLPELALYESPVASYGFQTSEPLAMTKSTASRMSTISLSYYLGDYHEPALLEEDSPPLDEHTSLTGRPAQYSTPYTPRERSDSSDDDSPVLDHKSSRLSDSLASVRSSRSLMEHAAIKSRSVAETHLAAGSSSRRIDVNGRISSAWSVSTTSTANPYLLRSPTSAESRMPRLVSSASSTSVSSSDGPVTPERTQPPMLSQDCLTPVLEKESADFLPSRRAPLPPSRNRTPVPADGSPQSLSLFGTRSVEASMMSKTASRSKTSIGASMMRSFSKDKKTAMVISKPIQPVGRVPAPPLPTDAATKIRKASNSESERLMPLDPALKARWYSRRGSDRRSSIGSSRRPSTDDVRRGSESSRRPSGSLELALRRLSGSLESSRRPSGQADGSSRRPSATHSDSRRPSQSSPIPGPMSRRRSDTERSPFNPLRTMAKALAANGSPKVSSPAFAPPVQSVSVGVQPVRPLAVKTRSNQSLRKPPPQASPPLLSSTKKQSSPSLPAKSSPEAKSGKKPSRSKDEQRSGEDSPRAKPRAVPTSTPSRTSAVSASKTPKHAPSQHKTTLAPTRPKGPAASSDRPLVSGAPAFVSPKPNVSKSNNSRPIISEWSAPAPLKPSVAYTDSPQLVLEDYDSGRIDVELSNWRERKARKHLSASERVETIGHQARSKVPDYAPAMPSPPAKAQPASPATRIQPATQPDWFSLPSGTFRNPFSPASDEPARKKDNRVSIAPSMSIADDDDDDDEADLGPFSQDDRRSSLGLHSRCGSSIYQSSEVGQIYIANTVEDRRPSCGAFLLASPSLSPALNSKHVQSVLRKSPMLSPPVAATARRGTLGGDLIWQGEAMPIPTPTSTAARKEFITFADPFASSAYNSDRRPTAVKLFPQTPKGSFDANQHGLMRDWSAMRVSLDVNMA